jgi:hypothetical protein
VKHKKARFKLRERNSAIKKRKKSVEFLAGLASNSFFFFKKRNPVETRHSDEETSEGQPGDASKTHAEKQ